MPHTGLVSDGGHLNTCRVNHLLNKQSTGEWLVNGAVFQNGRSAAVHTSESSTVGSMDLLKAPRTVNGHVDHKHKGKRTKAALPKEVWAEQSESSAVSNDSAAGVEANELVLGGISVSAATTSGTGNLCCKAEQVIPQPSLSAPRKNQNRKKKFRHKKRNDIPSPGSSAPPLMDQEQEDWEQEIQEVACTHWGTMRFGLTAYGPEDVIHLALRDLTLQQRTKEDPSATTSYIPAVHHAWPVHWRFYRAPTEPDQFANADE